MGRHTKRFLTVNAGLLLLSLLCFLACGILGGTLQSQRAAERWAGDSGMEFAQLSCFLRREDALGLTQVYAFRQTLESKLTEISLEPPEGGALYADAWSAGGTLRVTGEHGSADAAVTAVGGDFFLFHPLRLLSGSYIAEDDVMDDRVVLDRELAWRVFGGTDLAGMEVSVGGKPFLVAGVVDRERDFASEKARGDGMGLFMSYRAYANLRASGEDTAVPPVECYELVMPQPVRNYAESVVREGLKLGGGELVNNTLRYTPGTLWDILRDFGSRSMHRSGTIYPDWENAARCVGDWCTLCFAFGLIFGLCPAVTALVLGMVLLVRGKDVLARRVPAAVDRAVQRSRKKRYRGAHEAKKE